MHVQRTLPTAWAVGLAILLTPIGIRSAEFDARQLAEGFKAADMRVNDGKGQSESADSGTLGWGESKHLEGYIALWEVTQDRYWLTKITEHFQRIMGNASDPDGDGYLSWQTGSYSCAVAYAERLHNVSDADIAPASQKNTSGAAAAQCTGHTYILDFQTTPDLFRVIDWDTRTVIADQIPYQDGGAITQIKPFKLVIKGQTRQGDRFLVRTVAPEPLEFTVHQGMFLYPVALFIESVKTRPELQTQFGADADQFLAFINKHVFEKNERDWLDCGALGGGYRFEPRLTDRYPNRIMPHNQFAALARVWLVLKDVDGAHPLMAQRAEQMVRYFHSFLVLDQEHEAYRWHYWDWIERGEPGNSGWEDSSHASINVSLAVEAARRHVIFTDQDMQRIANTWLKVMWNRDEDQPRFSARVSGGEPYDVSALRGRWTELSQWDRRVYDLALKAFLAGNESRKIAAAPILLLCASRAGVPR